jgi:hypothetical protein
MKVALRAARALSSRWSLAWAAATGALLTLPSLGAGLAFDDHFFAVVLRRLPLTLPQRGPLDLFRFADGSPETARALMDTGVLAWNADPHVRGAYLRPLSALTHVVDYAAWPGSPALMHAQSVAWFAAAVVSAALVYRRVLGATWVAGLASLLYAMDDAHATAVTWIANRNALVAAAIGLPVLALHDRWRKDGWKAGRRVAPALFAVALLAGEAAVGVLAYLAAYAVHLDRGTRRARIASLAPYTVIALAWRVAYGALGYGVDGSDLYLDPLRRPAAFLTALPRRYVALLLGQLAAPRSDLAEAYPAMGPWVTVEMTALGVAVLAAIAFAIARLWRRDPAMRFFATGLLLATLPACATAPGGRLLMFAGVGAMGLVAQLIASGVGVVERVGAALLGAIHLVAAPALLAIGCATFALATTQDAFDRAVPRTADVARKTVVALNPPNDACTAVLVAGRLERGEPAPRSVLSLAGGTPSVDVERADDRSLRVRPAGGFLPHTLDRNWRSLERPIPVDSVVALSSMTATVTASTDDHRPAEALFRFDTALEDPSIVWLRWSGKAFVPWHPPPVGAWHTVH